LRNRPMRTRQAVGKGLPLPIDDPSPAQIVGRHLDGDNIAGHDADEVLAHFPRDVGQHLVLAVAGLGLDNELRVWQRLNHLRIKLNTFRPGHVIHSSQNQVAKRPGVYYERLGSARQMSSPQRAGTPAPHALGVPKRSGAACGILGGMYAPDPADEPRHPHDARSARWAALQVLADLHQGCRTVHEAIATLSERHELPQAERALTTELALGVVRHRLTLARLLGGIAAHGWKRIDRRLQRILMLGAYQLIWLDGIPAFAAVDEAVGQAKSRGGPRAARFVNAVLRQLQRDIEHRRFPLEQSDPTRAIPLDTTTCCQFRRAVLPDPALRPVDHLSLSTSHPIWLVSRWAATFGIEKTQQICRMALCRPPIVLRPNRLRTDAASLAQRLRDEGLDPESDSGDDVVAIRHPGQLTHMAAFADGLFQVQDRTARAVVREMSPQSGQIIIDLCAGSGTKTTQMAELMENRGTILASDKDQSRLAALQENCTRLGLTIVCTVHAAELEASARTLSHLDWILVDAPCSNTGVLARRPEARYRVNSQSLAALAELQLKLLARADGLATAHTRLAYSTCSLEPEENEQIAGRFSRAHRKWRLRASRLTLPSAGPSPSHWQDGGYWAIWDRT